MPLPWKLLSVPPVTVMSAKAKSVDASLRVKLIVSDPVTVPLLVRDTTTVGAVVSVLMAKATRLLPSWVVPATPER